MMKIGHLAVCMALSLGGFYCAGSVVSPARAAVQEIVAVVNADAISAVDLNKRLKLIVASSGLPNNKEIRARLRPQVLGGLINERLMLQEARKYDFVVSQAEIDQGFATVAQQNKNTPDQFRSMLRRGGIDVSTMTAQIEAQVAWSKIVQSQLQRRVIISDRDVDDVLKRLNDKIGVTEYLAAEIFLPFDKGESEAKAKNLANRLVREIKTGKASFFKLAQQFSKSAGSVNGGNIGWVHEAQVSDDVIAALQKIKKNQISAPIKTHDGYRILFLRDTRTLSEDNLPSRDQVYYNLGNERLDKLQRRHLQDLRSAAFIDIRV